VSALLGDAGRKFRGVELIRLAKKLDDCVDMEVGGIEVRDGNKTCLKLGCGRRDSGVMRV